MRYMLVLAEDETIEVSSEARSARFARFQAFTAGLARDGRLVSAERLRPSTTATTVRRRDGVTVVVDGPFAETKEHFVGFFVVECADLDEALAIAGEVPTAEWGSVEIRPVWSL